MRWLVLLLGLAWLYALAGCQVYNQSKVYNGQNAGTLDVTDSSYTLNSPATQTPTATTSVTADPTISKAPSGALALPGYGTQPTPTNVNVPAAPGTAYVPPPAKTVEGQYQVNPPQQEGDK